MAISRTGLEQVHVRFATFRERSLEEREADAARLSTVTARERIVLETCHRVELITVEDGSDGRGGRDGATTLAGHDAVRRVFEVVAGFDSAVVAEEQLIGQVRAAYASALANGSSGPILNELLRRALRFGRRVRSHARPGTDRSLADRGVSWLLERVPAGSRVLVVGTGEMGLRAATGLAGAGIGVTVLSRSTERGAALRDRLPGEGHDAVVGRPTAELLATHEALVLAVRAREPIVRAADLGGEIPWTVDLSTPAAVDTDAATLLGDRLIGVDDLGRLASAAPVLAPEAERRLRAELDAEVDRFAAWVQERANADAVAILHREADAVRRRHLDRLRRRADLDPDQLAAVEAASAAMLGDLLHRPSVELRRGGADAGAVRRLFGLEATRP